MTIFDELTACAENEGAAAALSRLAEHFQREGRYHDLFDVRLMQARQRLGLPLVSRESLDDLPEPQRTEMEEASLAACREVGHLLLAAHRPREGWMYLRPAAERDEAATALDKLAAETGDGEEDDLYEQLIEIALHEGANLPLGFRLVLRHYGLCNAITMFDQTMQARPLAERQRVAALLVRNIHEELLGNLRGDIERQQGAAPREQTIAELVADRDWLFENNNYHVDTTHLAAIIRYALVLDDEESLRLALDLASYGRRLSPQFHFATEEPFTEPYVSHALFFDALLGRRVEEALRYFEQQARESAKEGRTAAAEIYVALLARTGHNEQALQAAAELLPPGSQTSGFAPSLSQLAQASGQYERLRQISRERGDLLGFTAALVAGQRGPEGRG